MKEVAISNRVSSDIEKHGYREEWVGGFIDGEPDAMMWRGRIKKMQEASDEEAVDVYIVGYEIEAEGDEEDDDAE